MQKSCLVIAGEKSGEEHALSFFKELQKESPSTQFFGVGGDELKEAGLEILYHLNDFSSWGYSEVLSKIPFYFKAMDHIVSEVKRRNTKTAILVDFQSFNMKLAGKLKEIGVEVLYYVAPQTWAWKEYRVKKLAATVNTLFTIIPFEKEYFKQRGISKVISIDHPLWTTYKDDLSSFEKQLTLQKPLELLLLPGSRGFEVESLLPYFIESVKELKKTIPLKISIVKSSSVKESLYGPYNNEFDTVYTNEQLTQALKQADIALAASGTVTLTCALYSVPTIVCYKGSLLNQFIFETFVNYKWFISLANIVQNKLVFPELIQDQVSTYNIVSQIRIWYYNSDKFVEIINDLNRTKELVRGENINIPHYMAQVIDESYGQKNITIN